MHSFLWFFFQFSEDNLLQLARIQERIQEMRMANAQANLNVTSTNNKGNFLHWIKTRGSFFNYVDKTR